MKKKKSIDNLFCSIRKKFRKKSKYLEKKNKDKINGKFNGKDLFKAVTYANADMFMLETQLFIIENYLNYRKCILAHSETEDKIIKARDAIKWILDNREDLFYDKKEKELDERLNVIADFYKNGDIFGMWY